ncbi:hypothetical protein CAPTEDRAFT_204048 [Capitella teleta]|uniref:G-protein coupled receptors family 1 profile domain-containing protein n=1 Tax=Capitella teleta TaxID=283909 RepID=R7V566_CAPTE|nr:hypothetical protein CAPTEDRAFT_204048 [Capitella teleta]|eukprot:ELU13607.1 hypothetical protein CAPTEDRAFT_204048 [Capitella teleta]
MSAFIPFTEVTTLEARLPHQEVPDKKGATELWEIAVVILFIIVITGSVMGNTLIITVFFKFKNLQNATNCLICNQSMADLLTALDFCFYVSVTYFQIGEFFIISNKYACLLYLWAVCVSLLCSMVNIMAISIERVIAVALPYVNINPHKKKVVLLWITITWLCTLMFTSLPILGVNQWKYGIPCNVYLVYDKWYLLKCLVYTVFIVLVMTALLNVTLGLCALHKHIRRHKVAPSSVSAQVTSTSMSKSRSNQAATGKANNRRITIMLLVIVGAFYTCMLPYLCVTCYGLLNPLQYRAKSNMVIFHEFTKVFMAANGSLNPFIYANRNTQFKKAFKQMFGRQV